MDSDLKPWKKSSNVLFITWFEKDSFTEPLIQIISHFIIIFILNYLLEKFNYNWNVNIKKIKYYYRVSRWFPKYSGMLSWLKFQKIDEAN